MLITDELLFNYKRCSRRVFLNIYGNIDNKTPEKDFLLKLREESEHHCQNILAEYYPNYYQLENYHKDWQDLAEETQNLMRQGVNYIYQGKILYNSPENITYLASPTLLIKQAIPSIYGDWSYYPVNIQLGRRPKPEYKIFSGFQAFILNKIQGISPQFCEIILREKNIYQVNLKIWLPHTEEIIKECLAMLQQRQEPEVFISRQRCNLCQWYDSCYDHAKAIKHLSLIPGITPKRYELLQKIGINNVESLSKINPQEVSNLLELEVAINLQKQAQSIIENNPIVKSNFVPPLPCASIELYFDIEAEPERNIHYLLGVLLIDKKNNEQKYYAFLAETLNDEQKIWQEFFNFVNFYTKAPIFHYSNYEVETIKKLGQIYHTSTLEIDNLLSRFVDLHEQLLTSVILPVESYSLKSVANWLGFNWRNPFNGDQLPNGVILSGDQCVCWYDQWLKTQDRIFLQYILQYNEDDCQGTYHLKNWLVSYFNSLSNF